MVVLVLCRVRRSRGPIVAAGACLSGRPQCKAPLPCSLQRRCAPCFVQSFMSLYSGRTSCPPFPMCQQPDLLTSPIMA